MKRTKKILALLLAVCLLLGCLPLSASAATTVTDDSGSCGDNVTYTFNADTGTLTISGTGEMRYPYGWSSYKQNIVNVVVEQGVTSIGDSAFNYCSSLTSVTLPEGLTCIGSAAFLSCYSLKNIILPEGLVSIGSHAFWSDSAGSAGSRYDTYLDTITIPSTLQNLGEIEGYHAFFTVSKDNPRYYADEQGVLFNKDKTQLIAAPRSISGTYTVPKGVVSIQDSAFRLCQDLVSVILPEGLTTIGRSSFDCFDAFSLSAYTSLTSVTVPSTLTNLDELLKSNTHLFFTVAEVNPTYYADEKGVLFNKTKTEILSIPYSLSGHYTVPNGVTEIPNNAFQNCTSLASITLPEGLTSIGNYAFDDCDSLMYINIPASVTSIGYDAFYCSRATLVFNGDPPTIDNGAFAYANIMAYYPKGNTNWTDEVKQKYGAYSIQWSEWSTCGEDASFTIDANGKLTVSGTGPLYAGAFQGFPITSAVIAEGITDISNYAFRGCTSLKSVTIPSSVKEIGSYAFDGCSSLNGVTIPNAVKEIGPSAFRGCSSLTAISIPDSVTSMGYHTFENCTSLTSVTISAVVPIPYYAFKGCTALTEITIPAKLNHRGSIGDNAFQNCTSLKTVIIESVVHPKNATFYYGCDQIGDFAFNGCTSLEKVVIPKTVTNIGCYSFYQSHKADGNKPDVFYAGSKADWDEITFYTSEQNKHEVLKDINITYNSKGGILEPNWNVVSAKTSVPYGTKNKECFAALPSTGTATIDDATVSGKFEVVDGDAVQTCGSRTITVKFTVTTAGDYYGNTSEMNYTVSIVGKTVTADMISTIPAVTYNGAAHEPTLTVKNGSTTLVKDTDYTVSYSNNTNAGTATAKITGIGNYSGTASKMFTINKASITGYQTAASAATILANDANNAANKLKTAANLPAKVTVTYADGTAELPINWANASENFNVKGGSYTFKGTVPTSENFDAYTTPLTATLTVTAVNGTLNTTVPSSVVIAKNTAQNATSYADFKLPTSITIDCDNGVAQQVITPTWSVTLNELKSKKVGSKTAVKVTNLPSWLTMSDISVTVEITDKFPVTVIVGEILNVTYGTEIADPSASQATIDNGTDSSATYTYTYTGTTAIGTSYSSATKPTEAGDYTVTATLVSSTHAGSGSTAFKILPKNLDNSMIGAIANVTYNGKAQEPTLTVTDGTTELVKNKDFTVEYTNNTAVGTATATITGTGNYTGTASKDFTIDPIDISSMTVKVEGTAEVDRALLASVDGVDTVEFNWFVDSVQINNYTLPYLLLKSEYEGKEITVSATASGNYGGTTAASDTKTIAVASEDITSADVPAKAEITANAGNRQITVKATAESEKPVVLYAFKLCDSSDNVIKTVYSLTDSHTFTDLTNGTEFHISAVAFNVNGEGAWSDSESVTPKAPSYSGGGSSAPSDEENTKTLPNGNTVKTEITNEGLSIIVEEPTGEVIIKITLPAEPGEGKIFADVKDGSWYKSAVDKATGYSLFNGVSATKFEPKAGMTRGMLAQVLYNLSGKTSYGVGNTKFPDTQGWYSDSIDWAAAAGVVNGMPNGNFEPESEITREQLVVMLYNYANAIGFEGENSTDLSSYPDSSKVSSYAKEAMQWAVANKIVSGTTSKDGLLLNPKGTATRAEVATMMVHFVEYLK